MDVAIHDIHAQWAQCSLRKAIQHCTIQSDMTDTPHPHGPSPDASTLILKGYRPHWLWLEHGAEGCHVGLCCGCGIVGHHTSASSVSIDIVGHHISLWCRHGVGHGAWPCGLDLRHGIQSQMWACCWVWYSEVWAKNYLWGNHSCMACIQLRSS